MNDKNGTLVTNYSKYTQDSEVYYNGEHDEEKLAKAIGSIKAVKLG